jgi:hypothetical protein
LASIRYSLQIPGENEHVLTAEPAFSNSFYAPEEVFPTVKPSPYDEEYLGPVEPPINSAAYNHNMSSMGLVCLLICLIRFIQFSMLINFGIIIPILSKYHPNFFQLAQLCLLISNLTKKQMPA